MKPKTIPVKCLACEKLFDASIKERNRGNARYCSLSCSSGRKRVQTSVPNCVCALETCGKEFYRSPSKLEKSSSGFRFCSRKCKDTAQRIGEKVADALLAKGAGNIIAGLKNTWQTDE